MMSRRSFAQRAFFLVGSSMHSTLPRPFKRPISLDTASWPLTAGGISIWTRASSALAVEDWNLELHKRPGRPARQPAFDLAHKSGALFGSAALCPERALGVGTKIMPPQRVEYPFRLSNYALYARDEKGLRFFRAVLDLAVCRVLLDRDEQSGCDPEYNVLYTTGPDVISEVAQGQRSIGKCGGIAAATSAKALNMLMADPKSLVMNANSFTWRGRSNSALRHGRR